MTTGASIRGWHSLPRAPTYLVRTFKFPFELLDNLFEMFHGDPRLQSTRKGPSSMSPGGSDRGHAAAVPRSCPGTHPRKPMVPLPPKE